MAVIIAMAENESLKDFVFKLRYKIFSEEQTVYAVNEQKRTFDRFDTYPSTSNYIGFLNNKPIGSFRYSRDDRMGFPIEDHYDISSIRDMWKGSRIGSVSLGCIEKDVRSSGVYPMFVYQMGKSLSDGLCDVGVIVIRKDLSESFAKWGFVPVEYFFCNRVNRWLAKMYVEVKKFGDDQNQFLGAAKVGNFNRSMSVHLSPDEVFNFSQVNELNVRYSHFRVVGGHAQLFLNGLFCTTLKRGEVYRFTHEMSQLNVSILSKEKSEFEVLREDENFFNLNSEANFSKSASL